MRELYVAAKALLGLNPLQSLSFFAAEVKNAHFQTRRLAETALAVYLVRLFSVIRVSSSIAYFFLVSGNRSARMHLPIYKFRISNNNYKYSHAAIVRMDFTFKSKTQINVNTLSIAHPKNKNFIQ